MANYSSLLAAVNAAITANGTGAITGPVLNTVLQQMIVSLGQGGYIFKGRAIPTTDPGSPDQNVFYIATTPGTYTNFSSIVVAAGECAILKGSGTSWSKEATGIDLVSVSQNTETGHTDINVGSDSYPVASVEEVNQLGQEINGQIVKDEIVTIVSGSNTPIATNIGGAKTLAVRIKPTNGAITTFNAVSVAVNNGSWQILGQIGDTYWHIFDTPENTFSVVISPPAGFNLEATLTATILSDTDKHLYLDMVAEQVILEKERAQTAESNNASATSDNAAAIANEQKRAEAAELTKADIKYNNILDKRQVLDGSGFSASGNQFEVHDNWKGSYGALVLEWAGGGNTIIVSNVRGTGGFYCCQKDKNGVVIQGSLITDITGQQSFVKAENAKFLCLTVKPNDETLRANYGDTLMDYTDININNPIAGYLNETEQRIGNIISDENTKLFAYADGDETPDDETHFYGWKNAKCSIQRAIDAASNNTIIFCKGIFKVTGPSQFILQEDGFYNVVFIPHGKTGIELVGEGADKTVLDVALADNSDIASYQPLATWGNHSVIKGIGINAKNTRYCIHLDASSGRQADGFSISIINCVLRHYENTPNGYETPIGLGISDGMNLLTENCTLICERSGIPPLYVHDNKQFNEGFIWTVKNCHLVPTFGSSASAQSSNVNSAVQLMTIQSKGSGADGYIVLDENDYGSCKPLFINQQENINSKTNLADFSPKVYIGIRGNMAVPYGYDSRPLATGSKPGVLRITSKSAGADSKVRFDTTSSAFDIIVRGLLNTGYTDKFGVIHTNGYQYRDGTSNLHGYAMGELALDTGRICSMQKRLGDCSSTPKSLVVSVDGVSYTITFNQDYTNYSDADMLAVFTAVLGSVADVELYNWGADYFPEIEPSYGIFKNNNNYYIGKGTGVKIAGDGVRLATTDDEVDAIALDDILPNYYGRCCRKVMLSIFESDHHHISLDAYPQSDSDKYTSAFATDFGIDANTPGLFSKKTGGILKFKYYGYLILDKNP